MNEQKLKILTREEAIDLLDNQIEYTFQLQQENQELHNKIEYLKSKIENKDKWCQLIADIGYDYDGYRKAENLMSLIDELVKYSLYARDNYDYEEILKGDVDEM